MVGFIKLGMMLHRCNLGYEQTPIMRITTMLGLAGCVWGREAASWSAEVFIV
jgi:hypothetical protein